MANPNPNRKRGNERQIISIIVVASLILGFPSLVMAHQTHTPILIAPTSLQPASSNGQYWFQVGAIAADVTQATGAEVDIKVVSQKPPYDGSDLAFWVGLDTPNDAFIQVGYEVDLSHPTPTWFWEYFRPGTAIEGTGGFLGLVGEPLSVGSWVHFSVYSSGDVWSAYVNDRMVGSVNLGTSAGTDAYAFAEEASTNSAGNYIQPVEFRNLGYRPVSAVTVLGGGSLVGWQLASSGSAHRWFGAGSAEYPGYPDSFPYDVQSVKPTNNDWLAGSGLPDTAQDKDLLWPWYHVTISTPSQTVDEYYVQNTEVYLPAESESVQIVAGERLQFQGWSINGRGPQQINGWILATEDMRLTPVYTKQYYVLVSSSQPVRVTGSGWIDSGAEDTISVSKNIVFTPLPYFFLGWSGNQTQLTLNPTMTVTVNGQMRLQPIWFPAAVLLIAPLAACAYKFRRRHHNRANVEQPKVVSEIPAPSVTKTLPQARTAAPETKDAELRGHRDYSKLCKYVGLAFLAAGDGLWVWTLWVASFLGAFSYASLLVAICYTIAVIAVSLAVTVPGLGRARWSVILCASAGIMAFLAWAVSRTQPANYAFGWLNVSRALSGWLSLIATPVLVLTAIATIVAPETPEPKREHLQKAPTLQTAKQQSHVEKKKEPHEPIARRGTGLSTKFCRYCGAKIPRDSVFCEECGTKIGIDQ